MTDHTVGRGVDLQAGTAAQADPLGTDFKQRVWLNTPVLAAQAAGEQLTLRAGLALRASTGIAG